MRSTVSRWSPDRLSLRVGDAATLHAADATPIDTLIAALEADLDGRQLRRGTQLECVVAGEGVRYRTVPWIDELAAPAQRQLLAEQSFREAYGDIALGWLVREHAPRFGCASLACALDASLIDRLAALAQSRGLKLASVQPSLMHAYNRVCDDIEPGWFWFVCIEGPWTTALLMNSGEPVHVRRVPTGDGDLVRLLDREWFTLGIEQPRCAVYVVCTPGGMAQTKAYAWRANSHWQFIAMPGPSDMPLAEEEAA